MSLRAVRGARRRVTYHQLEILYENLKGNRELATGYNKTALARHKYRCMWERIAKALNTHKGANKDWNGWCKYWNDYKCKLKTRVAAAVQTSEQTGDELYSEQSFSELERKFLQIIKKTSGIQDVKVKPIKDEDAPPVNSQYLSEGLFWQQQNNDPMRMLTVEYIAEQPPSPMTPLEERCSPTIPLEMTCSPTRRLEIRCSPTRPLEMRCGPTRQLEIRCSPTRPIEMSRSSPRTQPDSLSGSAAPSTPAADDPQLEHQARRRRITRRRLRRVPVSQNAVLSSLCADSMERTRLAREKVALWRNMVEEMREIKNILNTRLPLPATSTEHDTVL